MYLDNTAIGKLQLQVNYSEPLTFSIQEGKYLRGIVYEKISYSSCSLHIFFYYKPRKNSQMRPKHTSVPKIHCPCDLSNAYY